MTKPKGATTNDRDGLDFTGLEPIREKVTGLLGRDYWLCEAASYDTVAWRKRVLKAYDRVDGALMASDRLPDTEVNLIHLCLYYPDASGDLTTLADGSPDPRTRVPEGEIRKWPPRILRPLFNRCHAVCAINDDEETEDSIKEQIGALQLRLRRLEDRRKLREAGEAVPDLNRDGEEDDGEARPKN